MSENHGSLASAWATTIPRIGAFIGIAAFVATRIVSETETELGTWYPIMVSLAYTIANILILAGLFVIGKHLEAPLLKISALGLTIAYPLSQFMGVIVTGNSQVFVFAGSVLGLIVSAGFVLTGVGLLDIKTLNNRKTTVYGVIVIIFGVGILTSALVGLFAIPVMYIGFTKLFTPKKSRAVKPMKPLS